MHCLNALKFDTLVHSGYRKAAKIVKIHFQSNQRWQTASNFQSFKLP